MSDTPGSLQREAAIIDPHLPEGYSADPEALISDPAQPDTRSGVSEAQEESSLMLQGGDIHRDIYKIKARANAPRRAATFSGLNPGHLDESQPSADDILQPGGFRRQHVQRYQTEMPSMRRRLSRAAVPVTKNFIGFLELYGDFAGEDLADTDSDDDESAIDDNERQPLNDTDDREASLAGQEEEHSPPQTAGRCKYDQDLLHSAQGLCGYWHSLPAQGFPQRWNPGVFHHDGHGVTHNVCVLQTVVAVQREMWRRWLR
jgi:hypothetical protein